MQMRFSQIMFLVICLTVQLVSRAEAQIITQFNFNAFSDSPSTGSGSIAVIGGTTAITTVLGSPRDPNNPGGGGGYQVMGFPANDATAAATSGTAGIQVGASTASRVSAGQALQIQFDLRQAATASRYFQLQASANGTTFVNVSGGQASFGLAPSPNSGTSFTSNGLYSNNSGTSPAFVQQLTYTFASGSPFDNTTGFAFRFVAVNDPTLPATGTYTASNTGSTYATSGSIRFDLVTVSVVPIPEPATTLALGAAGLGALRAARRRRHAPARTASAAG